MTTCVADIDIAFIAVDKDGNIQTGGASFNAADSSLQTSVNDSAEEFVDKLNDDDEDGEWEFSEYEVEGYDTDSADPDDFDDLDEYGAYAEKIEEHGEAYALRYADIGDFDFDDSYCGEWESAEHYVEYTYTDCHDIPDHLIHYIDWEKLTRDYMMDYSEYMDSGGNVHIFRD